MTAAPLARSPDPAFARFAGACGISAGAAGFLYSLAFVVQRNTMLSALWLMVGALLSSAALLALFQRLEARGAAFARWGALLALAGAFGALAHGGYDLANALHPPAVTNADLPSQADPRGLFTFGAAGLGLLVLTLAMRARGFPALLTWLGVSSALLSIVLYLGRLIVLDATSPLIVGPALAEGFLLNPAWYIWLGITLRRDSNG